MSDPRPHIGEPLALDLLNTRWMRDGAVQDLLTDTDGLAIWLASNGLDHLCPADDTALRHLRQARDAIKAAVDGSPKEAAPLVDEVLAHGRIRATLTADGPGEVPEFRSPAWGPAWLAARNYLTLLVTAPDRIRVCAHEACVLYFFDTSRNGTRRWHSMATCGNRAKASRHYARAKED
ncbi:MULTISPECIES: CGNR zinc finger domain-containing protein [Streptomyces]|uniref:CGNR zinc finger domain-containing protein n=1 Tax=Streptomyces fuscus TaxID=3048495 RepID=A0ABT7IVI0_9ACTN|nr:MULTISPECIES: CGNR zinc finger domain-containing protein [Streptomyces]MCM1968471.1 CGNR zinc finger domain-containing protein [Streptomyces sp. G1]MDL2076576.1 CGNR zinc finger domain-containing protein [Streptomyces fuscus]SBT94461.1 Putative stress-induced transcription regulator [Streptomyces sp. DI166]